MSRLFDKLKAAELQRATLNKGGEQAEALRARIEAETQALATAAARERLALEVELKKSAEGRAAAASEAAKAAAERGAAEERLLAQARERSMVESRAANARVAAASWRAAESELEKAKVPPGERSRGGAIAWLGGGAAVVVFVVLTMSAAQKDAPRIVEVLKPAAAVKVFQLDRDIEGFAKRIRGESGR